jgi:hypothetical protein
MRQNRMKRRQNPKHGKHRKHEKITYLAHADLKRITEKFRT